MISQYDLIHVYPFFTHFAPTTTFTCLHFYGSNACFIAEMPLTDHLCNKYFVVSVCAFMSSQLALKILLFLTKSKSHLTSGILMAQLPAFIKVISDLGAAPACQPATGQQQDFFHHEQEYFVSCVWQKP